MEKWIQDFLSQQFLNSDITRFIIKLDEKRECSISHIYSLGL